MATPPWSAAEAAAFEVERARLLSLADAATRREFFRILAVRESARTCRSCSTSGSKRGVEPEKRDDIPFLGRADLTAISIFLSSENCPEEALTRSNQLALRVKHRSERDTRAEGAKTASRFSGWCIPFSTFRFSGLSICSDITLVKHVTDSYTPPDQISELRLT